MTLRPPILHGLFPVLKHPARAGTRTAGLALLCSMAFGVAGARGQSLFLYRDLNTGILSDSSQPTALRFMRHLWVTSDNVLASVVQKGGYEGHGLALYKSMNEGGDWTLEHVLTSDPSVVSDGVLDADNNLFLVTSFIEGGSTTDVNFIKLTYQPSSKSWTIDPLTPVIVSSSHPKRKLSRATLSMDTAGVIWCAFRSQFLYQGVPDLTQLKVFYSADGGYTWTDSGQRFGQLNRLEAKAGKLISVGSRTALIYQDIQLAPPDTLRYKSWAYREDSAPLGNAWTDATISQMVSVDDDTLGAHWSVAVDESDNIHLTYQDAGIRYLKYLANTASWQEPQVLTSYDGSYNAISVAGNGDLYVFSRFDGALKVFCKQYSIAGQRWSRWLAMSAEPHLGYLRMSSPDRFVERLPMVYETAAIAPYTMLYVLFDTHFVAQCR